MHIAYIILTLIILFLGALPLGLCWGAAWLLRSKPLWALGFKWMGVALSVGVAIIFLIGFIYGWRNIQVTRYYFMHSDVPETFDGYKIVQLSDLHIGTLHGHESTVRAIVDSVNALEPDLIVFTGDLVNMHADEEREFHEILRGLHAPDGIVSIMGNHDYMMYAHGHRNAEGGRLKMTKAQVEDIHALQDAERDLGWHLLLNDNHVIHRGQDSIAIIGVENDGDGHHFPQYGDLTKAQHDLPDGIFKVLLSHDPTHWKRRVLTDTNIPLTLSGHTHAMQFQIFGWSPSRWAYSEWRGEYVVTLAEGAPSLLSRGSLPMGEGGGRGPRAGVEAVNHDGTTSASQQRSTHRTLFVSSGIGEVGVPFRFGAWPEIVLITLRSK